MMYKPHRVEITEDVGGEASDENASGEEARDMKASDEKASDDDRCLK
jgi:hypothetical protein